MFSGYCSWSVSDVLGLFSSLSFQGTTYRIRSQITAVEDMLPDPDIKYMKLENALTNCIDGSGNFTATELKPIQSLVEQVTKDPEGSPHRSDSDDDDDGEITVPSPRAIPCIPFYSDMQSSVRELAYLLQQNGQGLFP